MNIIELIGGYVVHLVNEQHVSETLKAIGDLEFSTVQIESGAFSDKNSLIKAIYDKFDLSVFLPMIPSGWDGLSDLLWQKAMDSGATKWAIIITNATPLLRNVPELLFTFAEIIVDLQRNITAARIEDHNDTIIICILLIQ